MTVPRGGRGGRGGGGTGGGKPPRQRRGGGAPDRRPAAFWREVPEPDRPDPITPAADPTALLRSLGPPPLPGQHGASGHDFAAVVQRASGLATALAAAAGILAHAESDDDEQEKELS